MGLRIVVFADLSRGISAAALSNAAWPILVRGHCRNRPSCARRRTGEAIGINRIGHRALTDRYGIGSPPSRSLMKI
jgi:hypothetical protein